MLRYIEPEMSDLRVPARADGLRTGLLTVRISRILQPDRGVAPADEEWQPCHVLGHADQVVPRAQVDGAADALICLRR